MTCAYDDDARAEFLNSGVKLFEFPFKGTFTSWVSTLSSFHGDDQGHLWLPPSVTRPLRTLTHRICPDVLVQENGGRLSLLRLISCFINLCLWCCSPLWTQRSCVTCSPALSQFHNSKTCSFEATAPLLKKQKSWSTVIHQTDIIPPFRAFQSSLFIAVLSLSQQTSPTAASLSDFIHFLEIL